MLSGQLSCPESRHLVLYICCDCFRTMKLLRHRSSLTFLALTALLSVPASFGQSPSDPNGAGQVTLAKLFPPAYPPLARATRIEGEVELTLNLRKDGTVQNATVIKGHPLLVQAALDSAQKSQFVCDSCSDDLTPYTLFYTFSLWYLPCSEMGQARQASDPHQYVSRSGNHVILHDDAPTICDPAPGRHRSIKCLYLWKCSVHY
jgi:TonB family protein